MQEIFITKIAIKNIQNILEDFDILLDMHSKKHIVLIGTNGSGKTMVLNTIAKYFDMLVQNGAYYIEELKKEIANTLNEIHTLQIHIKNKQTKLQALQAQNNIISIDTVKADIICEEQNILHMQNTIDTNIKNLISLNNKLSKLTNIDISFNQNTIAYNAINNGFFVLAYFGDDREFCDSVPSMIHKISIEKKYTTDTKILQKEFLYYITKLKVDMLSGMIDSTSDWFCEFEAILKLLFDTDDLRFLYDSQSMEFCIEYLQNRTKLHQLPKGYASVLSIVGELILRGVAHDISPKELQGVVLIDEIEIHQHIQLQKRIFRFLNQFFPNIQFIFSTHSTFVLSSLQDSIIVDMDKKMTIPLGSSIC